VVELLEIFAHVFKHILDRDVDLFHYFFIDILDDELDHFELLEQFLARLQHILGKYVLLTIYPQVRKTFLG